VGVVSLMQNINKLKKFEEKLQAALKDGEIQQCRRLVASYIARLRMPWEAPGTFILPWLKMADHLFDACLFQEALQFAELAEQASQRLPLTDERSIQARFALGNMLMNCQRNQEGLEVLQTLWNQLSASPVRTMTQQQCDVALLLSENCLRLGRAEDGRRILLASRERALTTKGFPEQKLLEVEKALALNCLGTGRYAEGWMCCRHIQLRLEALHLQGGTLHYSTCMTQALLEKKRGNHVQYFQLSHQALHMAEAANDLPEYLNYLNNALESCILLGKIGDYFSLLAESEHWLEVHGASAQSLEMCQIKMTSALVLVAGNEKETALKLVQDVMAQCEKYPAKEIDESPDWMQVRYQAGCVLYLSQSYQRAEKVLIQVLSLMERMLGGQHTETLRVRRVLAKVYLRTGRAELALKEVQDISQIQQESDPGYISINLNNIQLMAEVYANLGRPEKAFRQGVYFFKRQNGYVYQVFDVFDEQAWRSFTYQIHKLLHSMIGWAVDEMNAHSNRGWLSAEDLENLYTLVLQYKNLLYDQEWAWKAGTHQPNQTEALQAYYSMLASKSDAGDNAQWLHQTRRVIAVQEAVQKAGKPVLCTPVSARELQKRLKKGEAVVDVIRYTADADNEGYAAFIVTGECIRLCDLGNRKVLDETLENQYLPAAAGYAVSDAMVKSAINGMQDLLGLDDLLPQSDGRQTLRILLDGPVLPRLPWQLIFPQWDVRLLPTLTTLSGEVRWECSPPAVCCDPWMDVPEGDPMRKALKTTKPCLCSVARLGQEVQVLTGKRAVPSALRSLCSPSVLHIAAHGVYDEEAPEYHRSQILLSAKDSSDDGRFFRLDAMQMNLCGTDLVALECCHSAAGYFRDDEGVHGFVRSFFIAGARHVLTALWEASALFSCLYMDQFYRSYAEHACARRAYEQAQVFVRTMTRADVERWMTDMTPEISALEDGDTVLHALREEVAKFPGSGACFDKPAYWACYVLHSRDDNE